MESPLDRILHQGVDLHCHGYPELAPDGGARLDDVELARAMGQAGLRGFVLKSHFWPTVGRAYLLAQLVPEVQVIPSITLNRLVGGFAPPVVEAAARQGARVVFLPTWTAAHDQERGGFCREVHRHFPQMVPWMQGHALRVVDQRGTLLPEVREILSVAKELNLVLCTGHIAPSESLAVAEACEAVGFGRLVFSHPNSGSVGASLEEMEAMAQHGAFVEFTALSTISIMRRTEPRQIAEWINRIGPEHCVLSSDAFNVWAPPAPELLRMFVGQLRALGVEEAALRLMVRENPAKLLGL